MLLCERVLGRHGRLTGRVMDKKANCPLRFLPELLPHFGNGIWYVSI